MRDTTADDRPIVTLPRVLLIAAAGTAVTFAISAARGRDGVASAAPSTDRWTGTIEEGAQLRVDNTNGAVRVARSTDGSVHIVTTRTARGRRAEPLRLHVERRGADLVSCVVADGASCDGRGGSGRRAGGLLRRLFRRTSPTQVDVVVALPAGARLKVSAVNGGITVADAAREVELSTVNGSIVVGAGGGGVHASTVNGSVTLRLDGSPRTGPVRLDAVNGSLTALLPATTAGLLDVHTVNGRIESDFAPERRGRRTLQAPLNGGGAPLRMTTVNGSVRVTRLDR